MSGRLNRWRFCFAGLAVFNLLIALASVVRDLWAVAPTDVSINAQEWTPFDLKDAITIKGVRVNSSTPFAAGFTNISGEQVEISRVATTCGCTDIEFHPTIIAAGGKGEIRGRISAKSRSGVFQVRATGEVRGLSSGRSGTASLLITVDVVAGVEVDKTKLVLEPHFGVTKVEGRGVLVVRNLLNSEQVISVSNTAEAVSVVPAKFSLAPMSTKELAITAAATRQPSAGKILITSDNGESHTVDLQVRPELPVAVSSERLVLGVVSRGKDGLVSSSPPTVTLQGKVDSSNVVVKELPAPLLECAMSQEADGLRLTFLLAEVFSGKLVRGDIVLLISTEELPETEFRIPVIGVFRDTMEVLP